MSWLVLDVSKYNDISNYASCASGISGVIIRCGYRGYGSSGSLQTDNHFNTHYEKRCLSFLYRIFLNSKNN